MTVRKNITALLLLFSALIVMQVPLYADDMPVASPSDIHASGSTPPVTVTPPTKAAKPAPDIMGTPASNGAGNGTNAGNGNNKVTTGINYSFNKLAARKYPLGPNDVISISFLGMPELNHASIRVQPDGYIILDVLGPVYVTGLTMTDLYNMLEAKYAKYYTNPQISLDLVESKPFLVYITGSVLSPGSYEVYTNPAPRQIYDNTHPEITINRTTPFLTSVLTASGGLAASADLENIEVHNQYTGDNFTVNLLDLLQGSDINQDIYLIPGDTVVVNKLKGPISIAKYQLYSSASFSPKTIPIKVFGYVNNPGLINLPTSTSTDLMSAITAAGGFNRDSAYAPRHVYIFRKIDEQGTLKKIEVATTGNATPLLPNDIVYVPEKPIPRIGKAFDFASRLIAPAYLGVNTYFYATNRYLFKSGQ